MTTQSSKMAAGLPVAFGHRYLLERLERRLQDSLNPPDPAQRTLEPSLVAGVFGEWGAGKSHFLAAVGDRVRAWPRVPGTLNVVVAFNAWHRGCLVCPVGFQRTKRSQPRRCLCGLSCGPEVQVTKRQRPV